MAEAHKRAYRHPKYKTSYRLKNWPEYGKSLRNRGNITFWISQDAIDAWTPQKNRKRGGQPIYSDIAIKTSLILRMVFHLPLRQAEGFLKSLLKLMDLHLPCPDHTTVSRRNRTVNICRSSGNLPNGPMHFIVDSTGLKIWARENGTLKSMEKGYENVGRNFTLELMRKVRSWLLGSPMDTNMIRLKCLTF